MVLRQRFKGMVSGESAASTHLLVVVEWGSPQFQGGKLSKETKEPKQERSSLSVRTREKSVSRDLGVRETEAQQEKEFADTASLFEAFPSDFCTLVEDDAPFKTHTIDSFQNERL